MQLSVVNMRWKRAVPGFFPWAWVSGSSVMAPIQMFYCGMFELSCVFVLVLVLVGEMLIPLVRILSGIVRGAKVDGKLRL